MLIAIVLGGMCEGFNGWDAWPIAPASMPVGARRDAEQARHLAGYLKLDRVGWSHVIWKAHQLGRSSQFRRLACAIADTLGEREVLTADDLKGLMAREAAWKPSASR